MNAEDPVIQPGNMTFRVNDENVFMKDSVSYLYLEHTSNNMSVRSGQTPGRQVL